MREEEGRDWLDKISTVIFYISIILLIFLFGVQVGKWSERNESKKETTGSFSCQWFHF